MSELTLDEVEKLCSGFESFLFMVEACAPNSLVEVSHGLQNRGQDFWSELLKEAWTAHAPSDAQGLLAQIYLQPYAELLRSRALLRRVSTAYALCPFCNRKPGLGVMRQVGDGGARSMVCSFCLAEWEFRRIVCPGCGEENEKALPVFTASEFDFIRVESCDTCKTYIKTVDLTKMDTPSRWSTSWHPFHSIFGRASTVTPSCKIICWGCSSLMGVVLNGALFRRSEGSRAMLNRWAVAFHPAEIIS